MWQKRTFANSFFGCFFNSLLHETSADLVEPESRASRRTVTLNKRHDMVMWLRTTVDEAYLTVKSSWHGWVVLVVVEKKEMPRSQTRASWRFFDRQPGTRAYRHTLNSEVLRTRASLQNASCIVISVCPCIFQLLWDSHPNFLATSIPFWEFSLVFLRIISMRHTLAQPYRQTIDSLPFSGGSLQSIEQNDYAQWLRPSKSCSRRVPPDSAWPQIK